MNQPLTKEEWLKQVEDTLVDRILRKRAKSGHGHNDTSNLIRKEGNVKQILLGIFSGFLLMIPYLI
jgi:hypothetical protein